MLGAATFSTVGDAETSLAGISETEGRRDGASIFSASASAGGTSGLVCAGLVWGASGPEDTTASNSAELVACGTSETEGGIIELEGWLVTFRYLASDSPGRTSNEVLGFAS